MSAPDAATTYADHAWHGTAPITQNVQLARDTFRVRFECPELARRIVPGQFLMLRLNDCNDPLLGRPLALYDTVLDASGEPVGVDVVYLVHGKLTSRLARQLPGQRLDVWGPLGNGFPPDPVEHLVMVAGGIGQTPFMALGREFLGQRTYGAGRTLASTSRRVTLCYGARTREYLAGVEDFRALGIDVRISTDDGSAGQHGLVTDLLKDVLTEANSAAGAATTRVVTCGPEPMMAAVVGVCGQFKTPCQVSLETPMACGVGICFTCVARVYEPDGSWDYRRTCVEGPVFDGHRIAWDDAGCARPTDDAKSCGVTPADSPAWKPA